MAESKVPVLFLEVCERRKSGFVQQGTENTQHHTELDAAEVLWVPSSGFMRKNIVEIRDGKEVITPTNIAIRWIKNCDEIEESVQNARGIKPNPKEDKIMFVKGYATVPREGNTKSLYDYLEKVFYSEDAPDRGIGATKLYRVIKLDQKAEAILEDRFILAEAIQIVRALIFKKDDIYQYNEDRILALCSLFQVFSESWSTKVRALMALAEANPQWFVDQVTKFEQVIETEILHALELRVIKFEGNVAQYVNEDKVIRQLGTGNINHQNKIQRLSDYLKTQEASGTLTELRSKIELAKSKL